MTAFPKLLDAALNEVRPLRPISYKLTDKLTPLSTAALTLPSAEDVPLRSFVELFTEDGSAGIFRVSNIRSDPGSVSDLTLQHGLCTLSDHMHPGESTDTGSCRALLTKLLSNQSRWTLGTVDVPDDQELTWKCNNTNDLQGLLSIMKELPGYCLDFDQRATPWVLHVRAKSTEVECEARFDRNLTEVQVEYDDTDMCTLAYADGLDAPIQADTHGTWGEIARHVSADEALGADVITETVQRYLEKNKNPRVTITLTAMELSRLTGESFDHFRKGTLCRCILPEMTAIQRIESIERPDPIGAPEHAILTLASTQDDLSVTVAGLVVDTRHVNQLVSQIEKNLRIETETIDLIAQEIRLFAYKTQVDGVASRVNTVEVSLDAVNAELLLKASTSDVIALDDAVREALILIDGLDARIDLIATESSVSELAERVSRAEIRINGAEQTVDIFAGTLDEFGNRLDGAEVLVNGMESKINLKADKTTVDGLDKRMSQAELDIDGANAAIALKANQSSVDDMDERLSQAEVDINAAESAISLKANQSTVNALQTRLSQAEVDIDGANAAIDLKADLETVEGLDKRLSQAEVDIDGANAQIALKANQSTVTALGNRVSSAELRIDGAEAAIDLWAGEIDEFGNRLDGAEIKIDGLEKDITAAVNDVEGKVAVMELSLTDLESSALMKTVYEENRTADLQLISDAEKSIATLRTQHGNQIAGLEFFLIDLESSALMKTEYEKNREADLQLISNATESVERLETKYDGQIASLELKTTEQYSLISAKADLILLEGYVKMGDFEALRGEVSDLMGGLATFTVLNANVANVTSLNTTFLDADSFYFAGSTISKRSITMGDISSVGMALSTGALDLSHSHAVTVNGDGTITLGEVSSTGGSFKIADTKYYQDGVSAARNGVTLTSMGWQGGRNVVEASNGKSVTVDLPPFSTSGGDVWNIYNQTTVYFYTGSVIGPLASKTIDASSVYEAGYELGLSEGSSSGVDSVTLSSSGWVGGSNVVTASNGKSITIDLPTFSTFGGTTWTNNKTTVYFSTPSVNGPLLSKEVDASSVYNSGYNSGYGYGHSAVTLSAAGWFVGSNVVSASNGKSVTVNLPEFKTSGGDTFNSSNKTTVYFYSDAANGNLASKEVDASPVYADGLDVGYGLGYDVGLDNGQSSVTLRAAGWVGGSNVVSASNGKSVTVNLPEFKTSGGDTFNSSNKTTVYFYSDAANGNLASKEVDASSVYNSGYNLGYGYGQSGVTLSAAGWVGGSNVVSTSNGKSVTVSLPTFSTSGGTTWSDNKTTVYFSTPSVNGYLASATVDASSVYEAGYELGLIEGSGGGADSVTLSSGGWVGGSNVVSASNGKSITIDLPEFSATGGTTWSGNKTTVYFSTPSVTGPLISKEVDASSVYTSGYSAGSNGVTISAAGWVGGSNVVSASNGKSVTVALPAFTTSGGTTFSNNKTTVYFYTGSVNGPLASREVDASSVYDAGYAAGVASVDTAAAYDEGYAAGYEAAKAAVKVTAGISQSGFPAQYYARYYYWATATIDGEEVGSASGYQSFNVSGAM